MKLCKTPDSRAAAWRLSALLLLIFLARVVAIFWIGVESNTAGDDEGYLASGIFFAQTGILSAWPQWYPYPSALVMPGMPFVTGVCSLLFGEGYAYCLALKLLWAACGTLTALAAYKTARLFLPEGYGLYAAAFWLLPEWTFADNIISTETPYLLFFLLCIYCTLRLGEDAEDRRACWGFCLAFLGALLFRANILIFPLFTAGYLLAVGHRPGRLLRRGLVFGLCVLVFVVPWSIRNYGLFHEFIPITDGAGNPMLLGTYQGVGYPEDSELDYKTVVYDRLPELHPDYLDENGDLKPELAQHWYSEADGLVARYRMKVWWENDPVSFLKTYLLLKPLTMLNWVYFWAPVDGLIAVLTALRKVNLLFCLGAFVLSLWRKELRRPIVLLTVLYFGYLYSLVGGVALERYGSTLMPIRYLLQVFGTGLAVHTLQDLRQKYCFHRRTTT